MIYVGGKPSPPLGGFNVGDVYWEIAQPGIELWVFLGGAVNAGWSIVSILTNSFKGGRQFYVALPANGKLPKGCIHIDMTNRDVLYWDGSLWISMAKSFASASSRAVGTPTTKQNSDTNNTNNIDDATKAYDRAMSIL